MLMKYFFWYVKTYYYKTLPGPGNVNMTECIGHAPCAEQCYTL